MRQDWEPEDLIEVWTLLEDDMKRVRNKSGATRLGFALMLRCDRSRRYGGEGLAGPEVGLVGGWSGARDHVVMSTRRTLGSGPSFSSPSRRAQGLLPAEWAALIVDDDPPRESVPDREVQPRTRRSLGSGTAPAGDVEGGASRR